MIKNIL